MRHNAGCDWSCLLPGPHVDCFEDFGEGHSCPLGPWFLWKLLIDERYQGRGYGTEVVRQISELVRDEGAMELLTSYVPEDGGPAGFYERLGFAPAGDLDVNGEVIMRLALP